MRFARLHLAVLALGFAAAALAWWGLYRLDRGKPTLQSRWVHELYVDKERIAQAVRPPRIVVIGGSAALFGLRADRLSASLGVPVVNFATHAGLDLDYLLRRSEPAIARGDLVLLSLEYELLNGLPREMSPLLLDHVLARDPAYLDSLPLRTRLESVWMMSWSRALKPWIENPPREAHPYNLYVARHLDASGDTLGNATVLRSDFWPRHLATLAPIGFVPTPGKAARLHEYIRACRERGATVVAVSPPLMEDRAYGSADFARKFATYEAAFRDVRVPLLLRPAETFYPLAVFFDTRYHLDSVAAEGYTARVAAKLAPEVARWRGGAAEAASPVAAAAADFPLARLVRAFSGWEPVSGIGPFEGPYPQWDLGPVVWLLSSETHLRARPASAGAQRLLGSVNATAPGQALAIAVRGREVARCTLPRAREFTEIAVELGEVGAHDDIAIRQQGARQDPQEHTALLRSLRIVPGDGGALPPSPCEPRRPA